MVLFTPASAGPVETGGNWLITGLAQIMLAMANLAIGLCLFFLRFFIAIASYNNYIDVDVVQLGWVMVRDVANMFFVVALLVIAFGTILGLEEYEWKKNLVKLIFAAIFINFSNLIAQLFIDVAHVFTMTFLNAISATSSGNLINMFRLDQITQMVGVKPDVNTEFNVEILAGTAVAALFAVLAAFIMGSYVYVMMARVVALWALIILSPLAYILGVLPKTQSYAERWWSEFTNHVIVAPIMVFFMWLAFATLGTGNILASIQEDIPPANKIDGTKSVQLIGANFVDSNEPTKLSLSKVSTWENMANFLIALAFLRVGVKTTEETGVWGTDMISDAWEFGKKAATIATGYAAGRWLMDRGTDTLKTGASALAYRVPLVGGRALTNYANRAKLKLGNAGWYRDELAKKLENPAKKRFELEEDRKRGKITKEQYDAKIKEIKGGSNFVTRGVRSIAAAIVETNGRSEKKAEDWAKAVEQQKTFKEENYSTSDSAGGRAKLEWGIKAHAAEEMAGSKKRSKYAIGTDRMLEAERQEVDRLAINLAAKKGITKEEAMKQVAEKIGVGTLTGLENTTAKARGQADNLEYDLKRHMDLNTAKERATALREAGRIAEANSVLKSAYASANEAESKAFMTMSFNERVNQGGKLMEGLLDSNSTEKIKEQLSRNALQLLNISAQKGQEEFDAVLSTMLDQLYKGQTYNVSGENASTRIMEAVTGIKAKGSAENPSNFAEMQSAIDHLHHEKDEGQAVMSIFADSLKHLAGTGGVKYVGAVYEQSTVDNKAAQDRASKGASTAYGFVNAGDKTQVEKKGKVEEYFAEKVAKKMLLNLDGYFNVQRTGDKNEIVSIDTKKLASMLKGFGDTREVSAAFSDAFKNQMKTDVGKLGPEAIKQYRQLFSELESNYRGRGPDGFEVFKHLISTQFKEVYDKVNEAK